MIPVKDLITKLNAKINTSGLTELEVIQLSAAVDSLQNKGLGEVATLTDLPLAALNKGRYFYVIDQLSYYVSDGFIWLMGGINNSNNILWAWGSNANGRLGDNTTTNRSSPVSVVGGFTDWIQVAAGTDYSLGLRADGTAWAWGSNGGGRLGDGTTTSRSSPVLVIGGFTDWIQVASDCRSPHSLGLRADGTAWAWGSNSFGQLGDNTTTSRSSPVSVLGGYTDWIQIAGSSAHSLGLRANGTVWGWGNNGGGRLGNNTTTNTSFPILVVGEFTDWIHVGAGSSHSLGIRANGTAWAWGENFQGRLGDNTTTNRSSPVSVVGGFTDWIQVTGGGDHSLGVRANGTAWAWGLNNGGQLGTNNTTARSSPVSVIGGFTDWIQVAGGAAHSLGLRANGTAWAWGANGNGCLGDGTISGKPSPVLIVGGVTGWIQVAAGDTHSLGL
jgi:alpha-tubulin suppressor-like RCC1 family protein